MKYFPRSLILPFTTALTVGVIGFGQSSQGAVPLSSVDSLGSKVNLKNAQARALLAADHYADVRQCLSSSIEDFRDATGMDPKTGEDAQYLVSETCLCIGRQYPDLEGKVRIPLKFRVHKKYYRFSCSN